MAKLPAEKVFTPGAYPEHTYVERAHENYEQRLEANLRAPGILTSILGPSKSGKTVLVQKVVGAAAIRISGSDIPNPEALWHRALARMGHGVERSVANETTHSVGSMTEGGGEVGLPLVAKGHAKAGATTEHGKTRSETTKFGAAGFEEASAELVKEGRVLVIDDFHYVDRSVQVAVARQLKEAIARGVKAVVLAVPHRGDDPIRANPDLRGRVESLDVGSWKGEDLVEVGKKGFPLVGLEVTNDDLQLLAREALGSPQFDASAVPEDMLLCWTPIQDAEGCSD